MPAGEVGSRLRRWSSHQLVLKSIARGRTTRGDTQLAVDGAQVRVNGMQTEHQLLGDLRVRQSLCQQAQDFDFTSGQPIGIGGCWLGGWSWLGEYRLVLGSKSLFWGHGAALGPGSGKDS